MFIFWSFSRPIDNRFSHSEEFVIYTYRYFFKRFLASLCEGNIAKTASFVFLFQYVDLVLFYILSEYLLNLFFDLHVIQNNFKNIFSQDLIG